MRADRDDTPHHLRSSKGGGNIGKWLIFGLVGTSITGSLLYLTGARIPFLQPASPLLQTNQPQDDYSSLPAFEDLNPTQPTAEGMFWSSVKAREEERKARIKQTDYNDQNYVPGGADNVVSFESVLGSREIELSDSKGKGARDSRRGVL